MSQVEALELFHVRSKRHKGWFWLDNEIIERFCPVIGYAALGVYVVLCRRADNDDQSCFPSISGLSKDLKMGRDKVIECLEILEEANLIRCDRAGKNSGVSNTYFILSLPEGSPKAGLPKNEPKKSQGRTTQPTDSSPETTPEVVPRQDSKEDSVKEDSIEREGTTQIDTTQDVIPWIEKQWADHQRELPKSVRHKLNLGPFPQQFIRQEQSMGKTQYRQSVLDYIRGPENTGMVNFAKIMAGQCPRKPVNGNGNGHTKQKTVTEMMMERHPELCGK